MHYQQHIINKILLTMQKDLFQITDLLFLHKVKTRGQLRSFYWFLGICQI